MNSELELLKRVKTNVLERIIQEFGTMKKTLADDMLSIIDVRTILYDEIKIQAESIIEENKRIAMEEFSR